jgi:hypothetical protein
VAYRMVAERDDQKVIKERASGLIVLANARVWESEGWQVMITDAEGKEFDPAGFEKLLGPGYAWSPQEPLSLSPQHQDQATTLAPEETEQAPTEEAVQAADTALADTALGAETLEAESSEAESIDELKTIEETEHYDALEPVEEVEYDEFGPLEPSEALEDEFEPQQ